MATTLATVAELWRYPVKSMGGERVRELTLDEHGVEGDRRFAVQSSGAPRGKPLLSGAERAAMLLFHASGVRDGVCVTAPDGEQFPVLAPELLQAMNGVLPGGHVLRIVRSITPLTDVRPVALLGTATVEALGRERGAAVDARRFRANVLLHFERAFAEGELTGSLVRVGTATLRVLERTPRCRIVTLDPKTAEPDPSLMRHLDRLQSGRVGVYGAVVRPGAVREGEAVELLSETGVEQTS